MHVAPGPTASVQEPIVLTEAALLHLKKLREESGGSSLLLRIGVKSGGCSGMSYTMDFEDGANIDVQDKVIERDGFQLVVDPMSLLYLFGAYAAGLKGLLAFILRHRTKLYKPCRYAAGLFKQTDRRRVPVPQPKRQQQARP